MYLSFAFDIVVLKVKKLEDELLFNNLVSYKSLNLSTLHILNKVHFKLSFICRPKKLNVFTCKISLLLICRCR